MHFISGALAGHRQRQVLRLGENPHRRQPGLRFSPSFSRAPGSLDNHVEIGDRTVQLALTAECHCPAAKCRKIIRLQSDDAIKISNCSVETRPWPSRDPAIVDRNVIVGH
jgi:hypothetical protein